MDFDERIKLLRKGRELIESGDKEEARRLIEIAMDTSTIGEDSEGEDVK